MDLTRLPDGIVSDVASYLAAPSRALLAVALTAPSASWRDRNWTRGPLSMASAELLASPLNAWEELNFGDVEKSLASRLSDDDLGAVLACIGAIDRLKMLRLSGCVNVTGAGLEPLRNSTVLEDVDISLVGLHESPKIIPDPMLSEDVVLPILQSILDSRSLKFIMLPKVWRERRATDTQLHRFLGNFRGLLNTDEFAPKCCLCNTSCRDGINIYGGSNKWYGLQNFRCDICQRYFCDGGCNEDEEGGEHLHYCDLCERGYCVTCKEWNECEACNEMQKGGLQQIKLH
ncbi:hypothetical protein ACHAXT_002289 [Thalassiosira profunda]